MSDDTIHIDGLDALLARVHDAEQLKPVRAAIKAAALYFKGKVSIYPAQVRLKLKDVYGQTFKSDKQRRYFFWALREGKIEVPYRRGESPGSQTFGRRWTIVTEAAGLRAIIANNATYGELLKAKEKQTKYARRVGWKTIETHVDEEGVQIVEFVEQALGELAANIAGAAA